MVAAARLAGKLDHRTGSAGWTGHPAEHGHALQGIAVGPGHGCGNDIFRAFFLRVDLPAGHAAPDRGVADPEVAGRDRDEAERLAEMHVLDAIDNIDVSFVVHGADVPGVQPAVTQRTGGFFGLVPISIHDARPPNADFSPLTEGHLPIIFI